MNCSPIESSNGRPMFEAFEPRLLLDSQIGTVAMPFDGYLSAAVYDANGQLVRTLLAREPELTGNVTLTWDGKDSFGRTVATSGTYTWKALVSQVQATDEGGVGDSAIVADDPKADAGYFVQSVAVNTVGGTNGVISGTFAKNDNESYYGDTTLSQTYSLNTPFSASGDFNVSDFSTLGNQEVQGRYFLGHFSSSTAANRSEFMGLEFVPGDAHDRIGIQARIFNPYGASPVGGDASGYMNVLAGAGMFHFTYSYDPNYGSGRLTLRIYNDSLTVDTTLYASLSPQERYTGANYDSFGMGIATNEAWTGDDPTMSGKLLVDNVTYSGNTGVVTFDTDPGWVGVGNKTDGNNYGWTSSPNADGSLYSTSYVEENSEIRKVGQDGSTRWDSWDALNFGIAADEKYTYITRNENGQDHLYRYWAIDGQPAGFGSYVNDPNGYRYIVLNSNAPDPKPADQQAFHYTSDQWRTFGSCWGVAADGYRVWVSNYRTNTLAVYDRETGALLGQFAINTPLGIAVDTSSAGSATVWVANNGDRLTKITFNGSTFTASTTITGLADPTGVTIGGPSHHLFVAESGHSHIHEYDISGTPVLAGLQTFGSKAMGGQVGDSQFAWTSFGNWSSLAIDPTGILNVTDDHRIQRFYTVANPAAGIAAGDLYQSYFSEFVPTPVQATGFGANGTQFIYSGRYEYEVDPEYTGGPRKGWLGDGSWRLVQRYSFGAGEENSGPGLRYTINGHDLLYYVKGTTITIYAVSPTTQRLSAIVGSNWTGTDLLHNGQAGRYNWTDTDGDGIIDWNGVGSGTDGEVVWNIPMGQSSGLGYCAPWVDSAGNIWMDDGSANIIKVPLDGFDSKGNPIYNWAHKTTVITYKAYDQWGFAPLTYRIDANGDIWALGTSAKTGWIGTGGINGADYIARFDSAGNLKFIAPTLEHTYAGFSLDETASSAGTGYYFTGGQTWVDMFTTDGLLVDEFNAGPASGGVTGWMDQTYCIGAFTHPVTGQIYVYTEECFYGKSVRFRMDNMNTAQRQQGTFTYTASTDPVGHWELDGNTIDAVSGLGATLFGAPTYVTGHAGSAMKFDGSHDYLVIPHTDKMGGYTVSMWVKATSTAGTTNIFSMTDGAYVNTSDEIRISGGKFQHYTYDGLGRTITSSTTVSAGTWYFVAITAANGGKARLYINGVEEGTATDITSLWTFGDRFVIARAAINTGPFAGTVDDVRVCETQLSSADILALYNGTMKPRVNVEVTDATAAEQGSDPGTFVIGRDSSAGNLTVYYTCGGSATNGTDYSTLSGSVVMTSGQSSVIVTVAPIDDAVADPNESMTITLTANAAYTIGSAGTGAVVIVDNDTLAVDPNSHWALEENLYDYAGHNEGENNGGLTYLAPPIFTDGLDGRAVAMDGNDDYMTLPYSTESSSRTISVWVKPTDATAVNIICRIDGSDNPTTISEQIRINWNGKFELYTNDGTDKTVTGTTTVQAGNWYNVAIVLSNNGMARLYVNGIEEGTAVSLGTSWTGGDRYDVGRYLPYNGYGYFKGLVDDVQVFDAPLSAAQLRAMYAEENTVSLVATDPNASEPGTDTGTFTITRTVTGGNLTVYYSRTGTATSGSDFSALSGSVVIASGQSSATITVTPIDDSVADANETVTLTLSTNAGYTIGSAASDTVTIADNEPFATVTASDPSAGEPNNTGKFLITRSTSSGAMTVYYTCTGTATSGVDYNALSGSVIFLNGMSSANVTLVPLDDAVAEGDETVILTLTATSSYNVGTPNSATVTIADDEPVVTVTASDANAGEQGPDTGAFTIARVGTSGNLTVYYSSTGTATSGADFTALPGSVVIPDGQTSAIVTVSPIADGLVEGNETVILTLSTNTAYNVGAANAATVNIADRPLLPGDANGDGQVNFADYLVLESNFGTASGASFAMGDFNADGAVNFNDYLTLESNFGTVAAAPVGDVSTAMALPAGQDSTTEPASLTIQPASMVIDASASSALVLSEQTTSPAADLLAPAVSVTDVQDVAPVVLDNYRSATHEAAGLWNPTVSPVLGLFTGSPSTPTLTKPSSPVYSRLPVDQPLAADALAQWEQFWSGPLSRSR